MGNESIIDPSKLTQAAKGALAKGLNEQKESLVGLGQTAKEWGVNSSLIDSLLKGIQDLFSSLLSAFGIAAPSAPPTNELASTEESAAPVDDKKAVDARAAAAEAAKGNPASGTSADVETNGNPIGPQSQTLAARQVAP
ncbi:MAG: hypothetical protein SFW64_04410 [Alphaproteobacteria bacterium]|nr:hypothetical protein [Alphaproteobacteria bacterium]